MTDPCPHEHGGWSPVVPEHWTCGVCWEVLPGRPGALRLTSEGRQEHAWRAEERRAASGLMLTEFLRRGAARFAEAVPGTSQHDALSLFLGVMEGYRVERGGLHPLQARGGRANVTRDARRYYRTEDGRERRAVEPLPARLPTKVNPGALRG